MYSIWSTNGIYPVRPSKALDSGQFAVSSLIFGAVSFFRRIKNMKIRFLAAFGAIASMMTGTAAQAQIAPTKATVLASATSSQTFICNGSENVVVGINGTTAAIVGMVGTIGENASKYINQDAAGNVTYKVGLGDYTYSIPTKTLTTASFAGRITCALQNVAPAPQPASVPVNSSYSFVCPVNSNATVKVDGNNITLAIGVLGAAPPTSQDAAGNVNFNILSTKYTYSTVKNTLTIATSLNSTLSPLNCPKK
jgi:hypothetical protein